MNLFKLFSFLIGLIFIIDKAVEAVEVEAVEAVEATDIDTCPVGAVPYILQPVVFHVIYQQNGTGFVPYQTLVKQINELNNDYSGLDAKNAKYKYATDTNIRFFLHGINYVMNDTEHQMCPLTNWQPIIKSKYAYDPAIYYNVYICQCQATLGLSWIPYQLYNGQQVSESHWILGSIVDWTLLPGSTVLNGRYNMGKILTHESGHHYGLQHIYTGSCAGTEAISDYIFDTPRQAGNPSLSCKEGHGTDSCPSQPGLDDIENYMGVYYDSCRTHFTQGQITFMHDAISYLKPTLVQQVIPGCVASIDPTDKGPDLRPCLGPVITDTTHSSEPRSWCLTDKTNNAIWSWACCPLNNTVYNMTCRTGTFTLGTNGAGIGLPFNTSYPQSPQKPIWTIPLIPNTDKPTKKHIN